MKNTTFKNGDPIPQLGLGTWRSEPSEAYRAVKEALRIGYRHIDCAAIYGNEKEVGQALRDSFREGIVRREELFVTSKLPSGRPCPIWGSTTSTCTCSIGRSPSGKESVCRKARTT